MRIKIIFVLIVLALSFLFILFLIPAKSMELRAIETKERTPGMHDIVLKASWNPNTEEDVKGYVLYYGPEFDYYPYEIDLGNVTEFEFEWFSSVDCYAILLCYDTSYNYSLPSKPDWRLWGDVNRDKARDNYDLMALGSMLGDVTSHIGIEDLDYDGRVSHTDMKVLTYFITEEQK